jgi:hypothetical protein
VRVCEEEDAHIRHTLDTAPPPPPPPRRIFFARRASFASAKSGPCLVSHAIFLCVSVCEEEDAHIRGGGCTRAKSGPCLVSHAIFLCVSVCEEEDAHIRHTLDTLDTHYIRNTLATH